MMPSFTKNGMFIGAKLSIFEKPSATRHSLDTLEKIFR
jgi:hypothetical protein